MSYSNGNRGQIFEGKKPSNSQFALPTTILCWVSDLSCYKSLKEKETSSVPIQ